MDFSGLTSQKEMATQISSKLKQKKVINKEKYLCKRPTKPVPRRPTRPACKTKEVTNSLFSPPVLQEKEQSIKKAIKCYRRKINSACQSFSCVDESPLVLERFGEGNFPNFVKPMKKSHVTGGFWLGLNRAFCREHLPNQDVTMILVDEEGEEYRTNYLVAKSGLSGGWRTFSIAHNLLEGDVLVFHLVEKCKFKVCIERAKGPIEIRTILPLNLACEAKSIAIQISTPEEEEIFEALVEGAHSQEDGPLVLLDDHKLHANQIIYDWDVDSYSDMFAKFKYLDSELSEPIKIKYYELCRSQKCCLHEHLQRNLNSKIVLEIIEKFVDVADSVGASKFSTPSEDLENADKILKGFEDLGMIVDFLRDRLKKLIKISYGQKKIKMKTLERSKLEEEIKMLKLKLIEAECVTRNLDGELEDLKVEGRRSFVEVASASW